ncbi:4-hydroxybenzoate synthetase [Thiocapsa imhoffii]|uniref:4-hydroxybenzoate synthetase n=1 Tax=Thiocapsa imhoffii TaxID=382777 RepID=A0A9X1B6U0_9GAMM|nr:chorismate pyruvate-lyase family protein [Thiocapsa imhoffii]MBK1643099.1 4-hydroxybenzoate synthetase [Thiocapsa imhoffii]
MRRDDGRIIPALGSAQATFRCDGFVRDGTIATPDGEPMSLQALPPFLRALLVTDGTVTKILEAYFWEPVTVETIAQRFEAAAAAVPAIDLEPGDRCLIRDARLLGVDSGRSFAAACSQIRTELIPEDLRQRLIDREIGIGVLIRDSGLESYREVLDVGLDADPAGHLAVRRTYRIIIERRPVILITERFPLALYAAGEAAA